MGFDEISKMNEEANHIGTISNLFYLLQRGLLVFLKALPFLDLTQKNSTIGQWQVTMANVNRLIFGMAILTINDNRLVLEGSFPTSFRDVSKFICYLDSDFTTQTSSSPFAKSSKGSILMIDDSIIQNGTCSIRKAKANFLFLDLWDGEIDFGNNEKTNFYFETTQMAIWSKLIYTEVFNLSQFPHQLDLSIFINFDQILGSTVVFRLQPYNNYEHFHVKFSIKNVCQVDEMLDAIAIFHQDHPIIAFYSLINDRGDKFSFILRRRNVPFYVASHGIIEFAHSKNGIGSITFASDGKEMRFQGTSQAIRLKMFAKNGHFIILSCYFLFQLVK